MSVVGLNFKKIEVERGQFPGGKVAISNNISIKNVEKGNLSLGDQKKDGLTIEFEFTSKYNVEGKSVGHITLTGNLLYMAADIKPILESWEKDKKLEKNVMAEVMNHALAKANVQALILAQTVNLPPPLRLPQVEVKE